MDARLHWDKSHSWLKLKRLSIQLSPLVDKQYIQQITNNKTGTSITSENALNQREIRKQKEFYLTHRVKDRLLHSLDANKGSGVQGVNYF